MNLSIITFESVQDKHRIMEGRPWLFDNSLLLLKQYNGLIPPQKMCFDSELFWVHLNNLPFGCMNQHVGNLIRSSLSQVIEVETKEDGVG